ncbi:hypothetical protein [Streptomyces sp. NPDC014676]
MEVYRVAPPADGIAGEIHHQPRVDERDVQDVAAVTYTQVKAGD